MFVPLEEIRMGFQVVAGVALMTLLFLSALMESKLLDEAAGQFFFDNHAGASDDHIAVSDKNGKNNTHEHPLALLPATNDHAM